MWVGYEVSESADQGSDTYHRYCKLRVLTLASFDPRPPQTFNHGFESLGRPGNEAILTQGDNVSPSTKKDTTTVTSTYTGMSGLG